MRIRPGIRLPILEKILLEAPSRLPTILAFTLLVVQLLIPWSVAHFVTQDGPSHVYSAITARDVLMKRDSLQRYFYHFRPGVIPNWTTTVVLAATTAIAGAARAEAVMVDLCVLVGFFSFQYAARSLGRHPVGFVPLGNFVFNSWFLWLGFFNFSLGMAMVPAVLGYFFLHREDIDLRKAGLLAMAMLLVFFTHLVPAVILVVAILTIAMWPDGRPHFALRLVPRLRLVCLATLPTILLTTLYAAGQPKLAWEVDVTGALRTFPLHVFATAAGRIGGQDLLVSSVLLVVIVTILGFRTDEWRSEKGALAFVALLCFAAYIFLPDKGLGGGEAKIRFSWAVFVLGCILVASRDRSRFDILFTIYIAILMSCNLYVTWQSVRGTSRAVEDYIAVTDLIPSGATFVRVWYPTPVTHSQYGMTLMGRDPLFHLDAYSASRKGSIDLSDYEGLNPIFPLALRPRIGDGQRRALWSLEGPGPDVAESLRWLKKNLARPIDYVVLVAEETPVQESEPGFAQLVGSLESEMHIVAVSRGRFVRVYQRMP